MLFQIDTSALQEARKGVPTQDFHLDKTALLEARRNVPTGEFH